MTAQLPFGSVPVARHTDPHTSHDAAASVQRVRLSQAAVLSVVVGIGCGTDEDIAVAYERLRIVHGLPLQSPSGLRTRRKELVRLGKLCDSGERSRLRSGRQAIVWKAT